MNLSELTTLINISTDVLRIETLNRYSSSSDVDWPAAYLRGDPPPDIEAKGPWLDRLARAAANGHPRRRLRIVPRPVSDYVRYAAEWGYVDNAAAGEDIRVLDEADHDVAAWMGDYYILDGELIAMRYDADHSFVEASVVRESRRFRELAERTFVAAQPFDQWWAANPDLHRDAFAR